MSQEWSRSIIGRYCTYLHNLTTPSSPRKRQLGSEKLMRGLILPWLEEETNIVLAGINLMCKLKEETYIVLAGIALLLHHSLFVVATKTDNARQLK